MVDGSADPLLTQFSMQSTQVYLHNLSFESRNFCFFKVNFQNLNVLPKLLKPLQEIFKGELEEQSLWNPAVDTRSENPPGKFAKILTRK